MKFHFRKDGTRKLAALMVFWAASSFILLQGAPAAAGQELAGGKATANASKPTSRLPDGHPDLNGYWDTGAQSNLSVARDGNTVRATLDLGANPRPAGAAPPRREPPSVPSYKPEFVEKVKDLAKNQSAKDPGFFCKPLGVPRIGPPHQIVQSAKTVVFFYQQDTGSGDAGGIAVRIIPTDGTLRRADTDPSYFGDAVGHWEGDTLVVETGNFNDDTWLGGGGYIHTTALHVVERVSREGDTLIYQATAEDPNVLTKPWVLNPRRLRLGSGIVEETPPCEERDESHLSN